MPDQNHYPSPLRILKVIILSVFTAECLLMLAFRFIPFSITHAQEAVLDAFLLCLFLTPPFYFFFYQPFTEIIHDLRISETALKESEQRVTTIIKTVGEGIITIGADSSIRFVNPELCRIFGYSEEDLMGQKIFRLIPDKYKTQHASGLERYLKTGESKVIGRRFEIEGLHKDGSLFPMEIHIKESLRDGSGDRLFTAAIRDVTQRKEAEREREALIVDLNKTNEELKDFAYVVSHDLKTPLRAIHNYSDFLREDLGETLQAEQKTYLDGLARAVRQSEEFVNDLLQLSRIGRQDLIIKNIDLHDFFKELLETMEIPPDVKIIRGEGWPSLDTEPTLLRQIFLNLIHNAIKFNRSSEKIVEIGWQPAGEEGYEVFVRDNGIGIEPRFFEQILRPFQRLHTTKEFEGTGIGLAIVVKAASRLNGAVRMESKPGEGSVFFVRLLKKSKE